MPSIYCRLSHGALSFRPETLAVPSEVTFEVSGLPAGQSCDLVIVEPRTLTPLASAQILETGRCTINTNTETFRALFAGDRAAQRTVLVQVGSPAQLLASGLVVARWNMLASDDVPPAPAPNTRWLTDADYRDLNSRLVAALDACRVQNEALTHQLEALEDAVDEKATLAALEDLRSRVDMLVISSSVDEAIINRVTAFNATTATADQLWQQVADLSVVLAAVLKK